MGLQALFFYLFAFVAVASAFMVIASRNPVYSVLFLILTFFNAAGLFMLTGAEFLAMILLVVYVGAVMVLFLFVVMMLDVNIAQLREGFTRYAPLGFLIAAIVVVEIGSVVWVKGLGGIPAGAAIATDAANFSNTRQLGELLYTKYLYPFELAAVILLLAIIAAIVLTMRQRQGLKAQDIGAQVAVRAADRIRIIKMNAEAPSAPASETASSTPQAEAQR